MQIVVMVILALATNFLVGCSATTKSSPSPVSKLKFIRNLNKAYVNSEEKPPLTMPAGMDSQAVSDTYNIPSITSKAPVPASTKPPVE